MSLSAAVRFTERLITDEALQRRAASAIDGLEGKQATQALLALAAVEGLDVSPGEMARVRGAALAAMELSDDDLDRVAGGLTTEEWEEKLSSVGEDAELANIDLGSFLLRQQQTVASLQGVTSMTIATGMAVIRKMG